MTAIDNALFTADITIGGSGSENSIFSGQIDNPRTDPDGISLTAGSGGTTDGAVAITAGGAISPGSSIGTISVDSLSLDPASQTIIEFDGASADLIAIDGDLNLDGSLMWSGAIEWGTTYTIMTYGGTLTDSTLTLGTPFPSYIHTAELLAGSGVVTCSRNRSSSG